VLIGPNATGKTHLMKLLYASAAVSAADTDLAAKLVGVFVPHQRRIGRLVTRRQGGAECQATIHRPLSKLTIRFSNHAQPTSRTPATVTGLQRWRKTPIVSAFIPVKEMLTGGAQLVALYRLRELELEEVYVDPAPRSAAGGGVEGDGDPPRGPALGSAVRAGSADHQRGQRSRARGAWCSRRAARGRGGGHGLVCVRVLTRAVDGTRSKDAVHGACRRPAHR
jgi:hypothetical protein